VAAVNRTPEEIERAMWGDFNPNNPVYMVKLLSQRIDQLDKEKKEDEVQIADLIKRVANMEKSFQRGAGALIVLPIVGTFVGLLFAYGKVIFAPWLGSK
jgi:hypothetical protein